MDVSLAPQLEATIRQKVERGRYLDANEVVGEALRLLDERDRRERELRAAVAVGVEQVARGETVPYGAGFMERLKQGAEEDARRGVPYSDAVTP